MLDPELKRMIAGAVAEVDPAQIAITRRLTPAQRFRQGISMIQLSEQVGAYRLCIRQAGLSQIEALRILRQTVNAQ